MPASSMNRRDFARLFAAGGSAALLGHPALEGLARRTASSPLARRKRSRPGSGLGPGARPLPDAARAVGDERGQPVPVAGKHAAGGARLHRAHGPRTGAELPPRDGPGEGAHPRPPRRIPGGNPGGNPHHPQHQRGQQLGVDRPSAWAGRRSRDRARQPSQQQPRLEGQGAALRLHRARDRAGESPPRRRLLCAGVPRGDHAQHAGDLVHPPDQHRRGPLPGARTVCPGA